jgi:hypothetical protein
MLLIHFCAFKENCHQVYLPHNVYAAILFTHHFHSFLPSPPPSLLIILNPLCLIIVNLSQSSSLPPSYFTSYSSYPFPLVLMISSPSTFYSSMPSQSTRLFIHTNSVSFYPSHLNIYFSSAEHPCFTVTTTSISF